MLLQVLAVPRPMLEEQEDVVDVLVAVPELRRKSLESYQSIQDHCENNNQISKYLL